MLGKRPLILMLVMLTTPLFVSSQFLNAGFRAGVNSNTFIVDGANFLPGDPEIGFAGGIFLRFKPGFFSLQPEMLFSHKTGMFQYSTINEGLDTFFRASLQHLDFPLIANLHIGKHLRVGTGPVFSYNIGQKVSFTTTNTNYSINVEKDIFKQAAYSWQFAGAIELRRLILEARYELGIDKMNYDISIPDQQFSLNPVIHSRTWQFTLGYKLRSPRKR